MDYQDKQEEHQLPSRTSGTGQVALVTNASTAQMYGLAPDITSLPTDNLTLPGNVGLFEVDFANKPELTNDSQDLVSASLNYAIGLWQFASFGHDPLDETALWSCFFRTKFLKARRKLNVGA